MKTASVYEVQHHFSRVLKWIAAGETVVIERRKVPVAKLVPTKPKVKPVAMPDFRARLKKNYGGKIVPDSTPLIAEMRAERF